MEQIANQEQAVLWNGASGQAWVDEQWLLDETYEPIEKLLADAVAESGARTVLDIGCGASACPQASFALTRRRMRSSAFADQDRVRRLLEEAGWSRVELAPLDIECAFPAASLERFITRLGPVGQVLRDADEATRGRVIGTIRAAFAPYIDGPRVRFIAACWMISARTT